MLEGFDYFVASICMEQANNKWLVLQDVPKNVDMKKKMLSVLSAKSYVECTCVAVHMAMTDGAYARKNRRYILNVLRRDRALMFLFYENYVTTLSTMPMRRELPMYRHVDVIECLDMESFRGIMDSLR